MMWEIPLKFYFQSNNNKYYAKYGGENTLV